MAIIDLVEDERTLANALAGGLEAEGHKVRVSANGREALDKVQRGSPDLAIVDLGLPDMSGFEVLQQLQDIASAVPVVIVTASNDVTDAVQAMKQGAVDYLQKPIDLDALRLAVDRVLAGHRRDLELDHLRIREASDDGLRTEDPKILGFLGDIDRLHEAGLAPGARPPVLLVGETGTGKGLLARTLHNRLGGGPFVELNCTAIPESLIEAELFGHERGSFTDAKTARTGLFAAAEGGTLFLDEIGHLAPSVQAKFLKVIEEKRVRRLGSNEERAVDVQVVAATNRDLDQAVELGEFRADLLHRLRVLWFEIPPLRERRADIVLLATSFFQHFSQRYLASDRAMSAEFERELLAYSWPGNVRELRNVIERSCLLRSDHPFVHGEVRRDEMASAQTASFKLPDEGLSLETLEQDLLSQALERVDGNRAAAAELLGMTVETLRYRARKFGLIGGR